jgi:hypothetical protein
VQRANPGRDGYDEAAPRIKKSLPDVAVISEIAIEMCNDELVVERSVRTANRPGLHAI